MVPKLEALGSGLQILQILQWSLHLQYCGGWLHLQSTLAKHIHLHLH